MLVTNGLKLMALLIVFGCVACTANGDNQKSATTLPDLPANFGEYWYQGVAELTHFQLEQARYGEIREGDAVLIFVTEDFLAQSQVKYEFGEPKEPIEKVLKLNANRRFFTGIYPYSTLTSVFTPVDPQHVHSLKLTNSVQEWCGQVYSQLNLRDNQYQVISHSYFQKEGDQQLQIAAKWLEDELWTRLRLNPASLPTGNFEILPSALYLRFRHKPIQLEKATAEITDFSDETLSDKPLKAYSLKYSTIRRSLKIIYEADFPFKIVAWEEKIPGADGWLTTRARKTNETVTDYWSKNAVADSVYRKQFGF